MLVDMGYLTLNTIYMDSTKWDRGRIFPSNLLPDEEKGCRIFEISFSPCSDRSSQWEQ
jgi:hypothetical protein